MNELNYDNNEFGWENYLKVYIKFMEKDISSPYIDISSPFF